MARFIFALITLHMLHYTPCKSQQCTYNFQFNGVGQQAIVKSPNYPSEYPPNVQCRYYFLSPVGTKININCDDFNVETSASCQYDVFFMSLSGDKSFTDQQYFCGVGALTRQTVSNSLAIGFHSDMSNPATTNPFRFQCMLSVVPSSPVKPSQCSCGVRNEDTTSRIAGGRAAGLGEFPWRCALYTQALGPFCGCSLISNKWVLTAAHCTAVISPGDTLYVDLGDHDLSSATETVNQLVKVDNIIQNNFYNPQTQEADISLLRLSTPVNFTRNISPVCLPWSLMNRDLTGFKAVASGWGTTSYGGSRSSVLRKVDLPILSNPRCQEYYSRSKVKVQPSMLCTYEPGKDTCQGDSGGSLDYKDPSSNRYYAVGITSLGIGCGATGYPGIYTRVTSFLNWIQGNTGETFCRI